MRTLLTRWVINVLIWIGISGFIGALGTFFLKIDFLYSSAGVAVALIINGFIAEWEDRK